MKECRRKLVYQFKPYHLQCSVCGAVLSRWVRWNKPPCRPWTRVSQVKTSPHSIPGKCVTKWVKITTRAPQSSFICNKLNYEDSENTVIETTTDTGCNEFWNVEWNLEIMQGQNTYLSLALHSFSKNWTKIKMLVQMQWKHGDKTILLPHILGPDVFSFTRWNGHRRQGASWGTEQDKQTETSGVYGRGLPLAEVSSCGGR